jgi:hypothetical protein
VSGSSVHEFTLSVSVDEGELAAFNARPTLQGGLDLDRDVSLWGAAALGLAISEGIAQIQHVLEHHVALTSTEAAAVDQAERVYRRDDSLELLRELDGRWAFDNPAGAGDDVEASRG